MGAERIVMHQLLGDLLRQGGLKPAGEIDRRQLTMLRRRVCFELGALARQVGLLGIGLCEWTETYPPAAIDMAPATRPATPVNRIVPGLVLAAATPTTRLAVETMPSLAPSTAARSQPIRSVRWRSA
jgi:hypothetical protein